MSTTVTTPNELEIRVERIFDAPRTHVFSVWTDPQLIPEWWGDGTVVEEMDVRPGGTYRFRTAFGVVEGEFREVEPPERLVQTFQNHLQTLEFEDLGEQTKLTQTMRFETTEERDTTMQYGVEEGAKARLRAHRRAAGEDRGVRQEARSRASARRTRSSVCAPRSTAGWRARTRWGMPISSRSRTTGTTRRSCSRRRARLRPQGTSCGPASHASVSIRRATSCFSTAV